MKGKAQNRKQRADQLLVQKSLCESREQAQRLIMAGKVRTSGEQRVEKPSTQIPGDAELYVIEQSPFVSRAAYKLKKALDTYLPSFPANTVVLDIGASTGGFTDLVLQRGAKRVYAVDVGYGQLHWRLRQDDRVVPVERVNARYLSEEHVPEPVDIITADVSFIALQKVLRPASCFLKTGGWCLALVKPQFQARPSEVRRGGVFRDTVVQERCVEEVTTFAESELGWRHVGTVSSPVTGPAGNLEYMTVFEK